MSELTYGADIELVAVDQYNHPTSIEGIIGGTKEKPRIVTGGNVQEDNILPEFAIDTVTTRTDFVEKVTGVRSELEEILQKYNMSVRNKSYAYFRYAEVMTKQGQVMGCLPDHNCWTGNENPMPDPKEFATMRTAGGHAHFGFPEADEWGSARREMAQWLDIFLGLQTAAMKRGCAVRSEKYGAAGAFREKPYGVEYRVLSNWWANPKGSGWVFDQVNRAYSYFQNGTVEQIFGDVGKEVQSIINFNRSLAAREFLDEHGLELVQL